MDWGSNVCTTGALMPTGSCREAADTREATWLAALSWFVDSLKVRVTMLLPVELLEVMSVMPLMPDTAFSTTCVTCWSTTLGEAPA